MKIFSMEQPNSLLASLDEIQKKLIREYTKALEIAPLIKFDKPESNIFEFYISAIEELRPKEIKELLLTENRFLKNNFLWIYILMAGFYELKKPNLTAQHLYRISYHLIEFLGEIGSIRRLPKFSAKEINKISLSTLTKIIEIIDSELEKFKISVGGGIRKPAKETTDFINELEKQKKLTFLYEI